MKRFIANSVLMLTLSLPMQAKAMQDVDYQTMSIEQLLKEVHTLKSTAQAELKRLTLFQALSNSPKLGFPVLCRDWSPGETRALLYLDQCNVCLDLIETRHKENLVVLVPSDGASITNTPNTSQQ